jgi:transposase InsO family protein
LLKEAKIMIESWRRHYNTIRPHETLDYKLPAPKVFAPTVAARASVQPRPAQTPALVPKPSMN